MCSILIADDELITIKQLFNSIIERNKDIKLIGITSSGKEALNYMEKEMPDILLLDLMMPEMSGTQVLDKLISEKEKYLYKTKIIIISSYLKQLYDSNKYRNYIYATLPKPCDINKLITLINEINNELKEKQLIKCIETELSIFNFNKGTSAYKYLLDCIYEILNREIGASFDLESDIYYKVAKINSKKSLQIKWSIDKLIDVMSINTQYDIIKEYFNFKEYRKPTTKLFIQHIIKNCYKNEI